MRKQSGSTRRSIGPKRISSENAPRSSYGTGGRRSDHHAVEELIMVDERANEDRKLGSIGCEHFGKCPGCSVNDRVGEVETAKSAQLYFSSSAVKKHRTLGVLDDDDQSDDFFKIVVPSPLSHWRTQAKLAVSPKSSWGRDGCTFGLYERGTHNVMPIPNCAVHHPSINRAVEALTEATTNVGTAAYNEDTGEGGLRYVQLQVERSTGKICLTLVWNAEDLKGCQPGLTLLIKELKRSDPQLWHSIWCHSNDNIGNAIFARGSQRWHPMDGPEFTREPIPGTKLEEREGLLYFSPKVFRQGNMDGFDAIAQHVARAVPPGSKVCELYAGIGILGLTTLAYHAKQRPLQWLRCSDENPENPRLFQRTVNTMSVLHVCIHFIACAFLLV